MNIGRIFIHINVFIPTSYTLHLLLENIYFINFKTERHMNAMGLASCVNQTLKLYDLNNLLCIGL